MRGLLLVAAVVFVDSAAVGSPLQVMAEDSSRQITLTLGEHDYEIAGVTYRACLYNGMLGGPIIRVRAGDTLRVTLKNDLRAEPFATASLNNKIRSFSTTNLHLHGLHISPEDPGDSMFVAVVPDGSYEYVYEIPADHMAGTAWYHPHFHGSTALQMAGGAAGLVIIEDPPGSLPPEIESLDEVNLLITHFNMPFLNHLTEQYESACQEAGGTAQECLDLMWGVGPDGRHDTSVLLVNGQQEPTIAMRADRWYRFRLVYHAVDTSLIMPSIQGCTVKLLAKDGIYLFEAPRDITEGFMSSGNRADWLVKCPPGTWEFRSHDRLGRRKRRLENTYVPKMIDHVEQLMATLVVTDQGDTGCELPTFAVKRPCYLVDLTNAEPKMDLEVGLENSLSINGEVFVDASTFVFEMPVGEVISMNLHGINLHPFHVHVNPLQIVSTPDDVYDGYFRQGDWQDTITLSESTATVRMQTDVFTGTQLIHCHNLAHEDLGMMVNTKVVGQEGARYTGARSIDPSCYLDDEPSGPPTIIQAGMVPGSCGGAKCCVSAVDSASPPPPEGTGGSSSDGGDDGGGGGGSSSSALRYDYLAMALVWLAIPVSLTLIGATVLVKRKIVTGRFSLPKYSTQPSSPSSRWSAVRTQCAPTAAQSTSAQSAWGAIVPKLPQKLSSPSSYLSPSRKSLVSNKSSPSLGTSKSTSGLGPKSDSTILFGKGSSPSKSRPRPAPKPRPHAAAANTRRAQHAAAPRPGRAKNSRLSAVGEGNELGSIHRSSTMRQSVNNRNSVKV